MVIRAIKNRFLGIYIHIPFCKSKCYYCDFVSFSNNEDKQDSYVSALIKEIKVKTNKKDFSVKTIYIGGGTPSTLKVKEIKKILGSVFNSFTILKDAEITIEINPGTVNKEKLLEYKTIGINRLSIGLQTDNEELLKTIGRTHTYSEFLYAYSLAKEIGFENINIDLMLALPNQSLDILEDTVRNTIKLNPKHISLYSLIVEDGTKLEALLESGELELPSEELERNMYWKTKELLEKAGYIHYEISNFSKVDFESKHNLDCWNQEEYLGFGLAAHSYIGDERYSNETKLDRYIENIDLKKFDKNYFLEEKQDKKTKQKEYMMLGLRKISGINIEKFIKIFKKSPLGIFKSEIFELQEDKLVEVKDDSIKLTKNGMNFANRVFEKFI